MPSARQLRPQLVHPHARLLGHLVAGAGANHLELFVGAEAVDRRVVDAGAELLEQGRDPHHEELVEVGGRDGQELDALEQRVRGVGGLGQHAAVELEPAELPIDIESGVGRDPRGRRWRAVSGCGRGRRLDWARGAAGRAALPPAPVAGGSTGLREARARGHTWAAPAYQRAWSRPRLRVCKSLQSRKILRFLAYGSSQRSTAMTTTATVTTR